MCPIFVSLPCLQSLGVFYLTSFFSVFAYLWLLIILQAWTPNVVTVEEASITFLFCPVLVVLAYLVDKGWHTKMLSRIVSVEPVHPDDDLVNRNQEVAKKMRCALWIVHNLVFLLGDVVSPSKKKSPTQRVFSMGPKPKSPANTFVSQEPFKHPDS